MRMRLSEERTRGINIILMRRNIKSVGSSERRKGERNRMKKRSEFGRGGDVELTPGNKDEWEKKSRETERVIEVRGMIQNMNSESECK